VLVDDLSSPVMVLVSTSPAHQQEQVDFEKDAISIFNSRDINSIECARKAETRCLYLLSTSTRERYEQLELDVAA
jgi:hypothetical protein